MSDKPASKQKKPMKARYPPTTGMGRYCTILAALSFPKMMRQKPSRAVDMAKVIRVVAIISSSFVAEDAM
jgi:hypothetical protein